MKRFLALVAISILACITIPVAATALCPAVPDVLCGVQPTPGVFNVELVLVDIQYSPWSIPDPSPDVDLAYAGTIEVSPDSSQITVTLPYIVNFIGVVRGIAPEPYRSGVVFEWDSDSSSYASVESWPEPATFQVEAFVFDSTEHWRWFQGCLAYTGSPNPWWDVSDACVWLELGPRPTYIPPPWPLTVR